MNRTKTAWINGLFLAITLVINALGATGVINGLSQKEVSDMYGTLVTPSPATFGIWGVIYSLLLITVVVTALRPNDPYYQQALDETTFLFRASCILNMLWIVTFSLVWVELSALLLLAFVVTLSLICRRLLKIQERRRWLLPLTFGIYTGWLFIATVVNIAAALVKMRWNGFGIAADVWAIVILVVAVLLVVAVQLSIRNAAFPLPIAWAYFGIYQFLRAPEGYNGQYHLLQIIALVGMAVLIGAAAIQLYRNRFAVLPEPAGAAS